MDEPSLEVMARIGDQGGGWKECHTMLVSGMVKALGADIGGDGQSEGVL